MSTHAETDIAARVFISYSRQDASTAVWLRRQLEAVGVEVFRDVDDTLPGEEWWQRLTSLISLADTIIFLLSAHSAASKVCADEVAHANRLHKRILPVVIEDVDWSAVPPGLAKIHGITLEAGPSGQEALEQVLVSLNRDIGWLREHTRLGERARLWRQRERDGAELLQGKALEEAEGWLSRQPASATSPTAEHQEFIAASAQAARHAAQERLEQTQRRERELAAQRDRAEQALAAARNTASDLANGVASQFQNAEGVTRDLVLGIVTKANALLDTLSGRQSLLDLSLDKIKLRSDAVASLLATGKIAEARTAADEALVLAKEAAAANQLEPRCREHLADAYSASAQARNASGDLDGALASFKEVIAIRGQRAAEQPSEFVHRSRLAYAHVMSGHILTRQGRFDEAYPHLTTNVELCEAMASEMRGHAHESYYEGRLAEARRFLGEYLHYRGRPREALDELRRGQEIQRRLSEATPSDTDLAYALSTSHLLVGSVLHQLNDLPGAANEYEMCAEVRQRLVTADPSNLSWRSGLVSAQLSIADILFIQSKTEAALRQYASCATNLEELLRLSPDNLAYRRLLADCIARGSRDPRPGADRQKSIAGLKKAKDIIDAVLQESPADATAQSVLKFIDAELARQAKSKSWSLWR